MTSEPDSEIQAMGEVAAALEPLDEKAVHRVLRWAGERYGTRPLPSATQTESAVQAGPTPEDPGQLIAEGHPRTDGDRALLVAYWFQQYREAKTLSGQQLNTELKQLGFGATNITHVLNRLIDQRPALMQQVSKSGRSKQARKQYRLTTAGIHAAQALMGPEPEVD